MPKMMDNRITPEIVGKELGMSAQAVRESMENGTLNIGKVNKTKGGQSQYIILPNMLYEATGIKLNGYEPPPSVKIDYRILAEAIVSEFTKIIKSA